MGSLLLSSGSRCAQTFVCALQVSVSPVLCKFWWLYGRLMATSSKRAYIIPRSAAPRAPAPATVHCWPIPLQETFKHSSGSVCVCPGAHKVCLSLLSISGGWSLILNVILPLLQFCWGFSFALRCGVSPQSRSRATQLLLQHQQSCWGFSPLDIGYLFTVTPEKSGSQDSWEAQG